ncbi:hypothetical protein GCM10011534_30230 [Pseudooceanicola nanhaiensis]|uniref:Uncharacterized protein n=1 Tax=Pseudooceanicola nanhaiensis TaxID=375761 RepID=A0A917T1E0_9RHOB|nr:hypothetical protein GCM10011534_30230 [Pseudooceanicola nanhaiensis]
MDVFHILEDVLGGIDKLAAEDEVKALHVGLLSPGSRARCVMRLRWRDSKRRAGGWKEPEG